MRDQCPNRSPQITVLGLGNVLYADEGIGVHVAEWLHRHHEFPDNVTIVDAGTRGLRLLPLVEEAERLLLIDAVDFGLPPGEVCVRVNGHIPAYLSGQKVSAHQNSMSEVLALAEFRGKLPIEIVVVGLEAVDLGKSEAKRS